MPNYPATSCLLVLLPQKQQSNPLTGPESEQTSPALLTILLTQPESLFLLDLPLLMLLSRPLIGTELVSI